MRASHIAALVLLISSCASGQKDASVSKEKSATADTKTSVVQVERINPETGQGVSVKVEVTKIACRNGQTLRWIYLEKKKNRASATAPSCFVKYKRGDVTKVVAKAVYQDSHCKKVAENLKDNLKNAGYTCSTEDEKSL